MTSGVATRGPRGVRFRSRLEARWAAFFELCAWPWEYEPELGLDGWIPDFALIAGRTLLVEVKPAIGIDELALHRPRIEASGYDGEVWLAGAAFALRAPGAEPCIGSIGRVKRAAAAWRPATLGDVKARIGAAAPADFKMAQRAWVRAGNALQWRKGR